MDDIARLRQEVALLRAEVAAIRSELPRPVDDANVARVFDAWRERMAAGPAAGTARRLQCTPKRRDKVVARLRDGYSPHELEMVVDAVMRDSWHVSRGLVDLAFILHSQERVDKWLAVVSAQGGPVDHRQVALFDGLATDVPEEMF